MRGDLPRCGRLSRCPFVLAPPCAGHTGTDHETNVVVIPGLGWLGCGKMRESRVPRRAGQLVAVHATHGRGLEPA